MAGNIIRAEARYKSLFSPWGGFFRFFPEPFLEAIITAAAILTAITTAITPFIIIIIAATAIGGTLIRVKALPFRETF